MHILLRDPQEERVSRDRPKNPASPTDAAACAGEAGSQHSPKTMSLLSLESEERTILPSTLLHTPPKQGKGSLSPRKQEGPESGPTRLRETGAGGVWNPDPTSHGFPGDRQKAHTARGTSRGSCSDQRAAREQPPSVLCFGAVQGAAAAERDSQPKTGLGFPVAA